MKYCFFFHGKSNKLKNIFKIRNRNKRYVSKYKNLFKKKKNELNDRERERSRCDLL